MKIKIRKIKIPFFNMKNAFDDNIIVNNNNKEYYRELTLFLETYNAKYEVTDNASYLDDYIFFSSEEDYFLFLLEWS